MIYMHSNKFLRNFIILLSLGGFLLNSCDSGPLDKKDSVDNDLSHDLLLRPNIVWLVAEDLGPYIAPFGDSTVETPNLSRLADEGVIYPNTFSPSGVCAPSRAAIATGMYPSAIGANHMRTGSNSEATGVPPYEAVPGPEVRMMSEILRTHGYYCTNSEKEDYQFKAPVTAWDESGPYAHWRNRQGNQPFFAVFNFTQTHESGLFEPYGFKNRELRHYQSGNREYELKSGLLPEAEITEHIGKMAEFPVPPYLPDTEIVRRDFWKMYNNIAEMDRQLGTVLRQLEEDGLLENTIVFFYGDHGGPMPRQKRLIYDSGLNTPLIIRFPGEKKAGQKDEQLISFVDFAPTLLSLVGLQPPQYMDGRAFLGHYESSTQRKYIHGAADRFDEITDAIRAVRDPRYKYIRNYRPEQGYYLPLAYRERIPTMQELLGLREEGKLDPNQALWFRETKDREELYDCESDPHELVNLANDPGHSEKLQELRAEMDRWINSIGDQPNLPEAQLLSQLWDGKESKPLTLDPSVENSNGLITITCSTDGASIGYKVVMNPTNPPRSWSIYQEPFEIPEGAELWVQAHRIGFEPSQTLKVNVGVSDSK